MPPLQYAHQDCVFMHRTGIPTDRATSKSGDPYRGLGFAHSSVRYEDPCTRMWLPVANRQRTARAMYRGLHAEVIAR